MSYLTMNSILAEVDMLNAGGYYRYIGSLTTPPCTEGIIWSIFRTKIKISARQVNGCFFKFLFIVIRKSKAIMLSYLSIKNESNVNRFLIKVLFIKNSNEFPFQMVFGLVTRYSLNQEFWFEILKSNIHSNSF